MKGIIFAILMLFGFNADARVRTEAIVGGTMVSSFEIDARAALLKAFHKHAGFKLPSDKEVRAEAFDTIALEIMKMADAERFRITATRAELDAAEAQIERFYKFKPGEMRKFVEKNKLNEATLRSWILADATWDKFAGQVLRAYVSIRRNELAAPSAGSEFEIVPLISNERVDGIGAINSCAAFTKIARERGIGISGEKLTLSRASMMAELAAHPALNRAPALAGPFERDGFISYFFVCSERRPPANANTPLDEGFLRARMQLAGEKLSSFERKYIEDLRHRTIIRKFD
ncbi:MAG: hypothetical protein FWD15_04455 [Alphaproteobacteria bacterium]|nr:hypothetical protein [Alphaproteobacteria bacterium]